MSLAPWATPGSRPVGPLVPCWDHAIDTDPRARPAKRYGSDLGPALGHCYGEDMRCHGCGAEWKKAPKPCPSPGKARRAAKVEGGQHAGGLKVIRYRDMTPEEREAREKARRERKASRQREIRAAERERKVRALEAALRRLRSGGEGG